MKAKDFGNWLAALSEGLSAASSDRSGAVATVRRIFDSQGTRTVAAVLKASKPEMSNVAGPGTSVGVVHDALRAFLPFVRPAAKKAYVDDLRAFIDFLAPFRQANLATFVNAVCAKHDAKPTKTKAKKPAAANALRHEDVDRYVAELKAAHTHDEAFREVYQRLERDRKVRAIEAAAIASAFAFETARSTPKKESLRRIWRKQEVFERASERFGPKSTAV